MHEVLPTGRAYLGSEFVVANTLAKWKMKLTLAKVLVRKYYQEAVLV